MLGNSIRRVATYERVSSEDQRERQTIKTQSDVLTRALDAEPEAILVERFVDDGVSGKVPFRDRPAGRRLLQDAAKRRFDEVWVYKIDRLGRDDVDPLVVWRDLQRFGVEVRSVTEGVASPFEYAIRVAMAAEERRKILERSSAGLDRAAREGRYTGGIVPFGYCVEGVRPRSRLVPDETVLWAGWSAAAIVRKIYGHLVNDGWSCVQVAAELNRLGVPTAYNLAGRGVRGLRTQNVWRAGRIRNLVVNTVYRGAAIYGKRSAQQREPVTGAVEPLVSEDVWFDAQAGLARHRLMPRNTKRVYVLRNVMRCGVCGLTYCGTQSRGVTWYRCNGQIGERGPIQGRCPGKSVKGDRIEPEVWADIEAFLRDPGEVLERLGAERVDDTSGAVAEAERVTLRGSLDELARRRAVAVDLRTRERITNDEFEALAAEIETERVVVTERLLHITPAAPASRPIESRLELLERVRDVLDTGIDDDTRRELVALLVHRITVRTEQTEMGKTAVAEVEYRFPAVVTARADARAATTATAAAPAPAPRWWSRGTNAASPARSSIGSTCSSMFRVSSTTS